MDDTTQQDKITKLEARVHWLENKLWYACNSLYRLGYEQDGKQMVERFGVDANAARRVLNEIGSWERTNLDNVQAITPPPPTINQQRPQQPPLNKPVTWSKELRGGWL